MREPVIVDVVRTAFGKRGGALANWHPADLLGVSPHGAARADRARPRARRRRHRRVREPGGRAEHQHRPERLGLGRAAPAGARHDGRPPVRLVPAGRPLRRGRGGRGPLRPGRRLWRRGHEPGPAGLQRARGTGPFPPSFMEAVDGRLWTQFRVSQVLADQYGITREEMDAYALESHRRAAESWDNGHFEREALAVPIKAEDGSLTGEFLRADEGIRRTTTVEALAALPAGAALGAGHGPRHHRRQLVADDRRRGGHAHRRAIGRRKPSASPYAPASRTSPWRRTTRRLSCPLRCR